MRALGAQGLHIIRQAAETAAMGMDSDDPPALLPIPKKARKPRRPKAAAAPPAPASPVFDREALRARLEASTRPAPGTSELLSRPLQSESIPGHTRGKLFECHDLMAMAPIHLSREGFKP